MGGKQVDLTDRVFERLTVVRYADTHKRHRRWECKCSCGATLIVKTYHLTSGATKSCGCYRRDAFIERNTTHGLWKHPLYNMWRDVKSRCKGSNEKNRKNYTDRGITLADRWKKFQPFYDDLIDMYNTAFADATKPLSIDRKDNDKGYEPGNIRFATDIEQARNQRNSVYVTINGVTKHLIEWAEEIGINIGTVKSRIYNRKWAPEKALLVPCAAQKGGRQCIKM